MLEFDFETLSALGLTPALASRALATHAALQRPEGEAMRLARVVDVHRESVEVHDGGVAAGARRLPRLARSLAEEGTALSAGDWVLAADDRGQRWVVARVPPTTHLARRDGDGRLHPVASNVDVAWLVMGLDDDFNPRRLERYLVMVVHAGVEPVVVLTKRDVAAPTDDALAARTAELAGRLPPHVEVIAVNATHASAAEALRHRLARGTTFVMLGSSGAGKSTLTNTLLGTPVQDTRPVRASDGRGMHTTTSRSLHRLPGGACVIDTPGVRTLRPDGDEHAVVAGFGDVEALAAACRFRDCRHQEEPGCAVREGVGADRLRNFHKLIREVRRDAMTPLDRRAQVAQWKARHRAARQRERMKRGDG